MPKKQPAASPHIRLTADDAAIVKAMIKRGDRQSDVSAYFGVNPGRIAEISTGKRFWDVKATKHRLPPAGPYRDHIDYARAQGFGRKDRIGKQGT